MNFRQFKGRVERADLDDLMSSAPHPNDKRAYKCPREGEARVVRPDSTHYPFYEQVRRGGDVLHTDPKGAHKWVNSAVLGGDASNILSYPSAELSIDRCVRKEPAVEADKESQS